MIYASAASRSTRRDGRMRKPPSAILGDYLFGGTALKQAREHTTSASITSIEGRGVRVVVAHVAWIGLWRGAFGGGPVCGLAPTKLDF